MDAQPTFFDRLPDQAANALIAAGTPIRYQSGALVQSRGDARAGLSIVREGAVRIGVFGADGNFVMTSLLGPGQTFGEFTLFADLPRTHDMVAVGPTTVLQIGAARFAQLRADHPILTDTLLSVTLSRMHILLEMLDAMRRLPLGPRAAQTLLLMAQSGDGSDEVKIRQSDLAFMLGVSRMSLSGALKTLVSRGFISLGYGEIRLQDRPAMMRWIAHVSGTALES